MNVQKAIGPTESWYPLRYHAAQCALWREKSRFVAVCAGRGSGKTELAKRRLVRYLPVRKPWTDARYFYAAPTHGQAHQVAWDHFVRLIPREWLVSDPSPSKSFFQTIFGSRLYVFGLDKPQRAEGVQWDGGVIDESSDIRPKTFDLSIRPALTHKKGWCWRIGVPKRQGIGAGEYKRFFERGLRREAGYAAYNWPSWDILPEAEINELRQQLDEKDFNEQVGASWETAGGLCFHAYGLHNIAKVSYSPYEEVWVGCDFNVDPMAWILCHKRKGVLEAFGEVWLRNTNTQAALDRLYERYGRNHKAGWNFVGDASSRQRRTSASVTDYLQIRNDERFKAKVFFPRANPPVRDRLSVTNAALRNAAGEVRIKLDRDACTNTLYDLENRALAGDGLPDDNHPDAGHATDALGYLLWRHYPPTLNRSSSSEYEITVWGGAA